MSAVIEVVSLLNAAPVAAFDLELDVDGHAASLSESRETAMTSTGRQRPGDDVTFRARHLGFRWRMASRITACERPPHFVDEQVRGPFRSVRHEHRFGDLGDGRTRMTDRLWSRAPPARGEPWSPGGCSLRT